MGKFLAMEKINQIAFKAKSDTISLAAKEDGKYLVRTYPFCLPRENAEENLYPAIRDSIRANFQKNGIKWHGGKEGKPSNHLCDSQICCANFLFPFADQPEALAALLRPVFPELKEMLPIEDERYVAFEWIGETDYLKENRKTENKRTRGANCTSADAAVRFLRTDGLQQIILIEWKYTESYSGADLRIAPSTRSRVDIYQHLYAAEDCPLNKDLLPSFEALFFEPFYQFMRQQFLAHEMEKVHEMGADVVSLLHIAPAHNLDFQKITSPALVGCGDSATGVWKNLVKEKDRFISVSTEQLFGRFDANPFPAMQEWKTYINERYPKISGFEN